MPHPRSMAATRSFALSLLFVLVTAAACDAPAEDPLPGRVRGYDTAVTVFDAEYVYFGSENRRQVDVAVRFPDAGTTYDRLTGRFRLHCPNDRCDHWDRYGTFGIVLDAGTEDEQYIELDRFVTAYRVGFEWEADLTALRPLLTGTQTMRVFIDTWVGEGHSDGDGWLFDATIDFAGGPPPVPEPIAVLPVWGHRSWSAGVDDDPVEDQVPPQQMTVPAHSEVVLRSFITGHGWNNAQNCAEFCSKDHYFAVDGEEWRREVWREDCDETVTDGDQRGTWEYSRAGWCPGAQVHPWDIDVTEAVAGASSAEVSYRLQSFTWRGDGDQPYYYVSAVMLVLE